MSCVTARTYRNCNRAPGRAQTTVSLPHSAESTFQRLLQHAKDAEFGSGRSSTRTSRTFSQQAQIGRLSWNDSLAATACSSPRNSLSSSYKRRRPVTGNVGDDQVDGVAIRGQIAPL